ncbi:MAG TPA: MauE/DoxX family redox-associated membrane protein [Rhizomicrobium sp.]|jgi:uncharacterized membrane protein YphA (DoxX/SURF4 family)|nr:MauE/DoxX family redox-associated membrane protein [Rhizomicrobium sp.]
MNATAHDLLTIAAVAGRVCAGLVFAAAGAQKLRHRSLLPGVIANYRLLPEALVAPASWLLPPAELALGLWLLSGVAGPAAAVAAMLLFALFALAMAINLRRGRAHIDCGCNSAILRQELRWSLVARNLALAVLLLPGLFLAAPIAMPVWFAGACAGAVFFMLYLLVNALAALPRSVTVGA